MSNNLTYYIDENGEENFLDENGTPIFKPGDCGEFEDITLPPLHTWDGKGFIPTGGKGGAKGGIDTCSGTTQMMHTPPTQAYSTGAQSGIAEQVCQYFADWANGLQYTNLDTYKIADTISYAGVLPPPTICRHTDGTPFTRVDSFKIVKGANDTLSSSSMNGTWDGTGFNYSSWADLVNDCISLGIPGLIGTNWGSAMPMSLGQWGTPWQNVRDGLAFHFGLGGTKLEGTSHWCECTGEYATPGCPCGWGPNGTPPVSNASGEPGVYHTTYPQYSTLGSLGPPVPNTHPACGTWHDSSLGGIPMSPCWEMYLTMPYCVNAANGGFNSGAMAVTINTSLPGAECRSAYDLAAMTNAQRQAIYNNTSNHNAGRAWVPAFVMSNVLFPSVAGVTQNVPDPTGVSPNLGSYYGVQMRAYKIHSDGTLAAGTCSCGRMACAQTCHGCTAQTSTTCLTNPGACEEYNHAASHLFYYPESAPQPVINANNQIWQGGVAMVQCCISGCTTPGDPNYDPLATCNDGTCANPASWDCISPGNCVDPGTGWGTHITLTACETACPPLSWNCVDTGQWLGGYTCLDPGNGTGQYSSFSACQSACPPDSWNCAGGTTCIDPGTGYGVYGTLATCQSHCPIDSWDCSGAPNWICSDPGTGLAQYSTLSSCQNDCYAPSWNCVSPGNCQDPGNGSGQYSTLAACNAACPPLSWNCIPCTTITQQVGVDSTNCGANSTFLPGPVTNLLQLISTTYPSVNYVDLYYLGNVPPAPGTSHPCTDPVTGNAYWYEPHPGMGYAGSIYQTTWSPTSTATLLGYGFSWNDFLNNLNIAYQASGNGSQGANLTPFTGLDALDCCNMMTLTCPYFGTSWTTPNPGSYVFLSIGGNSCVCISTPGTDGHCIDPGDGTGT